MNVIHRWTKAHAKAWSAVATRLGLRARRAASGLRGHHVTQSPSDAVDDALFAKEFDLIKDQRTLARGGSVTKSPSPK